MSPLTTYVVETIVTLLAIVAVAVLVLVAARRAGVGQASGPLVLKGRLPLEARRTIYLVKAGKKVLVVGSSEAGLSKLAELDSSEMEDTTEASSVKPRSPFAAVLASVRGERPKDESGDDDG